MIRNLSRKGILRETSPPLGLQPAWELPSACALQPGPKYLALPTQDASHSLRPTFLGFRKLGACLSSELSGREIKTLAVGRIIKALPVVDRALEPPSLLCCSLSTRPWGWSTWGDGSRALVWMLGKW